MTNTEKQPQTIARFLDSIQITMTCERASCNPNMDMPGGSHWTCTFNRPDGRWLHTPFSQGSAHRAEPTREEVMDCLASDAAGFENAQDFEDWASEYGYDEDSRKAYATFEAVEESAGELKAFLDDSEYQTLLWDVERN